MKVYISVDMEGVSGLVRWMDVASTGIDFQRNRSLMTADTNAAIEGAIKGGATEIIVEENHGVEDLCVLMMEEIDPRCRVIRGAGRPGATTMAGLTSDVDVILLIGHHASAGTFPGIMAHTISYGWFKRVLLHGQPIGEPDFFAIRAGELNVPIGMISGDQIAAAQVKQIAPAAETAVIKEALGHQSGNCIPPVRARQMILDSAEKTMALLKQGSLEPYTGIPAPYEFEVELKKPVTENMQANLGQLEEFEIVNDHLIRTSADNMELGFRRVAYLGYADLPGVTRY